MKRRIYAVSSPSSNPYLTIEDGVLVKCDEDASGEIVIPDGVISIRYEAFKWCEGLTSVTIPDSVTSIGTHAFKCCTSLKSVSIPDSVTSIENGAFSYCSSLEEVVIADSVTSIGDSAFANCYALTSVTIPNSLTSIGAHAFIQCESLASVTIPDGVTTIGNSAFSGCESLTNITIPDSVTSIGWHAFAGCASLTSVSAPWECINPDDQVFYGVPAYDNAVEDSNDDEYNDEYDDIELTFDEDYMGDQLGPIFDDACNALGIWCEPSVQGGQGSAYFMTTADDSALGDCDYQDLCSDMQSIWYSNDGDESKVLADIKSWLQANVLQ